MKTAAYYLLLVGLPFLGLLAILRVGSGIVPPRAIGGVWDVELAGDAAPTGCPGLAFGSDSGEMRVSQSGERATVQLSDAAGTSFSIELREDTLTGSIPASEPRGCTRTTTLSARVASEAGGGTMTGELRVADCPDCPTVALRATRRPGATRP